MQYLHHPQHPKPPPIFQRRETLFNFNTKNSITPFPRKPSHFEIHLDKGFPPTSAVHFNAMPRNLHASKAKSLAAAGSFFLYLPRLRSFNSRAPHEKVATSRKDKEQSSSSANIEFRFHQRAIESRGFGPRGYIIRRAPSSESDSLGQSAPSAGSLARSRASHYGNPRGSGGLEGSEDSIHGLLGASARELFFATIHLTERQ